MRGAPGGVQIGSGGGDVGVTKPLRRHSFNHMQELEARSGIGPATTVLQTAGFTSSLTRHEKLERLAGLEPAT